MIRAGGFALVLFIVGVVTAQEQGLERVKTESLRLRRLTPDSPEIFRPVTLHRELEDWIEWLLPQSRAALDAQLASLRFRADADLRRAGLIAANNTRREGEPGFIQPLAFLQPSEDMNKLAVTAGVDVPCGYNDAVYVYDYSHGAPQRILESHGTRDHDESILDVRFSEPDALGNQLILTLRYAVHPARFLSA